MLTTIAAYGLIAAGALGVVAWLVVTLAGRLLPAGDGRSRVATSASVESLHTAHDTFARHFASQGNVEAVQAIGALYCQAVRPNVAVPRPEVSR